MFVFLKGISIVLVLFLCSAPVFGDDLLAIKTVTIDGQPQQVMEWDATAYASSFDAIERDPRQVLLQQYSLSGGWRPNLSTDSRRVTDSDPRFFVTWPGEVIINSVNIYGTLPSQLQSTLELWVGPSRLSLTKVTGFTIGVVGDHIQILLSEPVLARVMVLRFFDSPGGPLLSQIQLKRLECIQGNQSQISEDYSMALSTSLPSMTVDVSSGDKVLRLSMVTPVSGLPIDAEHLLCEIIPESVVPLRSAYQDFAVGRAIATYDTNINFLCTINSKWAVSGQGNYGVYVSQYDFKDGGFVQTTRVKLGVITISSGKTLPTMSSGLPLVSTDLTSKMLPTLTINGQLFPFVTMALAQPSLEKVYGYHEAGVRLWKFNIGYSLLANPDISGNVTNALNELDNAMKYLPALMKNSAGEVDSYIILAPDLRPWYNWYVSHPDEGYEDAGGNSVYGVNFGSKVLNDDITYALQLFASQLASKSYSSRIIGVLPYIGSSGDGWGYQWCPVISRTSTVRMADCSEGDQGDSTHGFIKYANTLINGTPRSNDWPTSARTRLTNGTLPIVSDDRLKAEDGYGIFRNPTAGDSGSRDVIDYWSFRAESIANTIKNTAVTIKTNGASNILYGTHYGYTLVNMRNLSPASSQLGGHGNLQHVLLSSYVNLVNGGSSADKRGPDDNYDALTPLGSVKLHNKMPVVELDSRTPWTRIVPSAYQLYSFADFQNAAMKDIGFALTNQAGLWWYDQSQFMDPIAPARDHYNREAWYLDMDFFQLINKLTNPNGGVGVRSALASNGPSNGWRVAVFIDENLIFYQDTYAAYVYENLLRYLRESFSEAGGVVEFYLLEDYATWKNTNAATETKLEVFLNPWKLPNAGWVTSGIQTSSRAQLWFYAAGVITRTTIGQSPFSTTALLGFDLQLHGAVDYNDAVTVNPAWRSLPPYQMQRYWDGSSQRSVYGEQLDVTYAPPTSLPTGCTGLGSLSDGSWALVKASTASGTSGTRIFSMLPYLPADVLLALYEDIGVVASGSTNDVPMGDWWVNRGNGVTCVNTKSSVSWSAPMYSWINEQSSVWYHGYSYVTPGKTFINIAPPTITLDLSQLFPGP